MKIHGVADGSFLFFFFSSIKIKIFSVLPNARSAEAREMMPVLAGIWRDG